MMTIAILPVIRHEPMPEPAPSLADRALADIAAARPVPVSKSAAELLAEEYERAGKLHAECGEYRATICALLRQLRETKRYLRDCTDLNARIEIACIEREIGVAEAVLDKHSGLGRRP